MKATSLALSITLILLISAAALASNVEHGSPVVAKVLSVTQVSKKNATIKAELQSGCRGPDVFWTPAATVVKIEKVSGSFTKGQKIKVRWMKYSAMSPNGPVSGTSWQLVP